MNELPNDLPDVAAVHQQLADVLDTAVAEIKQIWSDARTNGVTKRPAWPTAPGRAAAATART